ncbi:hypothetical protein ACLMJK_003121 [Lecanora helva]
MLYPVSSLYIGLFFLSVAASRVLQLDLPNSTIDDLLSLAVPENETNILELPSSSTSLWPAAPLSNTSSFPPSLESSNATSVAMRNLSSLAGTIKCDGRKYGFDLSIPSCEEAWDILPKSFTPVSFGKRPNGEVDVALPFRVLSSDGLCAIDIVATKDLTSDVATSYDIAEAALGILDSCVKGPQAGSQGGVAGFLGLNGGLAVRIVPYKVKVKCENDPSDKDKRAPPSGSCRNTLDWMPATYDHQQFGPRGVRGVEVGLPQSFRESNKECVVTVYANKSATNANWYIIYLAAIAIDAMCLDTVLSSLPSRMDARSKTM